MNRVQAALSGVVMAAAALAGVATSQAPPPSPVAAVQVDLPRSREDAAALARARQDPLAARIRSVMAQDSRTAAMLQLAAESPVPVLGPSDPALLAAARLFTGDRHYMMSLERGGQVIEIYGSTKAFRSPVAQTPGAAGRTAAPARLAVARAPARSAAAARRAQAAGLANLRTEQTEYGHDVAFSRFGAAYSVSFICDGQGAPGCGEADAVAFAASLVLIGGGA
ncbi:MAG: hypothetical protein H2038_01310 [Brevundimonas sp.]|uniref:hypothetical protein n=1 Tax=Brevundimonas sp. TaxID=1871086 RepID=UPI001846C89D|nr:hypothetical protein [Brevundimonas sp.]MBA4803271.1 hypothetical protein [Brevundimonas sp.]